MAVVRVYSKNGKLLSPTTDCAHVRHLLKDGKAKVVGSNPFSIQLLEDEDGAKNHFTFNNKKGRKVMSKAKKKNLVIVVAMIAVLAIGSISAYFTAVDTATNVFTVGSVEIDQKENGSDDPVTADDIVPNQEIKKTVTIDNTGINDAYLYTVVAVPKKVVRVAGMDGSIDPNNNTDGRMTQLFQLNATENGAGSVAAKNILAAKLGKTDTNTTTTDTDTTNNKATKGINLSDTNNPKALSMLPAVGTNNANTWSGLDTFNDKWFILDVNPTGIKDALAGKYADVYNDYNIYLFAYGSAGDSGNAPTLTALPGLPDNYSELTGDDKTAAEAASRAELFQSVTVANVVDIKDMYGIMNASGVDENSIGYDSGLKATTPTILVKSFAIQTTNLQTNESGMTVAPADVWTVLNAQNGAYKAVADELYDEKNDWNTTAADDNTYGSNTTHTPVVDQPTSGSVNP